MASMSTAPAGERPRAPDVRSAPAGDRGTRAPLSPGGDGLCPACRRPDALVYLGVHRAHLSRWRPWITARATTYLCAHCHALVDVTEVPSGRRSRVPHPPAAGHVSGTQLRPAVTVQVF